MRPQGPQQQGQIDQFSQQTYTPTVELWFFGRSGAGRPPPGITIHRALGSKGTFTPGPGHENPVIPALSPLSALTQGALMPMFTSRFAVKIPVALLLGLVGVGSAAA